MSFGWTKVILAGATALMLGGAAHAADFDEAPYSDGYGYREQASDYGRVYDAPAEPRHHWHERRFYGRPVAEYRPWARPVFARPAWSRGGECRVIIKERVNRWGERVVRKIEICD